MQQGPWGIAVLALGGVAACVGLSSQAEQRLVRVALEPAGAHCAEGGIATLSGTDTDGDGQLDDLEIETISYACSQPGAPPPLIRVAPEPAGANCPYGGTAVLVGLDDDRDGVLSPAEVDSTSYVCNGGDLPPLPAIIYGNLTIENQVDAARLGTVEEVTGSLVIDAPGLMAIDLGRLRRVGEDLQLTFLNAPTVTAPVLTTVGRDLRFRATVASALVAPVLATVGGTMWLDGGRLSTLALPALVSARDINLDGFVGDVSLPALTAVHKLVLSGGATESVTCAALTQIGAPGDFGELELNGGFGLDHVSFPALTSVDGNLYVVATALATLDGFPSLTDVTNQLVLASNDHLVDVDLPTGFQVVNLAVWNNPMFSTCLARALALQFGATLSSTNNLDDTATCP